MSLWGTAFDAEVEYRAERLRAAWGGRRRAASKDAGARKGRRGATPPEPRGAQIRRGLSGMRPAPAHRGLFA